MRKAKEIDRFGNVSYTVTTEDGRIVGRILKTGSSTYQVERFPFDSYVPVRSIKAGMDWLTRYAV